jgi:hypothetical protein
LVFTRTKVTADRFYTGIPVGVSVVVLVVEFGRTATPGIGNAHPVFVEHTGGCFIGAGN